MNTKSQKWIPALLTVVFTAVCIMAGILISGHFGNNTSPVIEEVSEEPISLEAFKEGEKAPLPNPLRATRVYLTELESLSEADKSLYFAQIVECGFNSVVIIPSESISSFKVDAPLTDSLKSSIQSAREKGLYCAVSVLTSQKWDKVVLENIQKFSMSSGVDALIFSDLFSACQSLNATQTEELLHQLDDTLVPSSVSSIYLNVPFSALADPKNKASISAFVTTTETSSHRGIYTEPESTIQENGQAIRSTFEKWLSFCSEGTILWISQNPKTVLSTVTGIEKLREPFNQLSLIYSNDTSQKMTSTLFCSYSSFAKDEQCRQIVRGCMKDHILPDSYLKTFKVTNHNSTSITTDESKVTFVGECSPLTTLSCNGQKIQITDDGYFSAEYTLKPGKNVFSFSNNNKKYDYSVQYNLDLIKSISPSGSLSSPGGNALEVSVIAHRNAKVTATLNGTTITLTGSNALLLDDEQNGMDSSSDYVTFTGKFNLPQSTSKAVNLGNIKASASYQGIKDSITGAKITVTAAETVGVLPVVDETKPTTTTTTTKPTTTTTTTTSAASLSESEPADNTEKDSTTTTKVITAHSATTTTTEPPATTTKPKLDPVITPYTYNGVPGTKRMCVIKTYYTETMPLSPLNDLSVPLTTPLLTGTFDFIVGESSFDQYTYYNLGSGRRVYRKDVEVIEKAYAMPANKIELVSSGTSGNKTNINLHLKWKVPFNVILNGQRYINDPKNKREYAVSSLNASSLDITFYYTSDAVGQPNVASSGVISSSEWIHSASAQTYTLRLHLRNAATFYGYSVSYNSDDTLNISIKERSSSGVSGKTIMLDPGHGGSDIGAPCAVNGNIYNEAKLTLAISEKVRAKLIAFGANVLMTRTSNSDVSLVTRKKMARQNNPDAFISIHCDSATSASGYGTTGFYYRPYSMPLAKSIHSQLVNTYTNSIYRNAGKTTIDRGTVFYPYSVCRIEECPSVLIECGYVSNLEECKILQNSSYQDLLAAAIANGINNYFS